MGKEVAIPVLPFLLAFTLLASTLYAETTHVVWWTKENNGSWITNGTIFHDGDSIEFLYNETDYNVVAVDKHAYETCRAPEGAFKYNNGDDIVYLNKGENYFICTKRGCCENSMKMMIVAVAGQ